MKKKGGKKKKQLLQAKEAIRTMRECIIMGAPKEKRIKSLPNHRIKVFSAIKFRVAFVSYGLNTNAISVPSNQQYTKSLYHYRLTKLIFLQ